MADSSLARFNADLSERAQLAVGLDARLALIDPRANVDMYHVLQGLEDPDVMGEERYFSYQHWGCTGAAGNYSLEGPWTLEDVKRHLYKVFKDKSGVEWGSIQPGDRVAPGKYWLQQSAKPDAKAKWEYYVGDGVDGKRPGWYPYTVDASDGVESLYAQHHANNCESRTSSRVVDSGYFSYKVDLEALTQQNTRTNKVREIRRVLDSGKGSCPAAVRDWKTTKRSTKKRLPRPVAMRSASTASLATLKPVKAMLAKRSMKTVMKLATKNAMKKKPSRKKAMKKKPSTKKAMKKKSIIAKGKHANAQVWRGSKTKTASGCKKTDMKKSRSGKIVSKKKSALGCAAYKNIATWVSACSLARKQLDIKGFMPMKKGTPLYEKAKELQATAEPHVPAHFASATGLL